MRFLRRIQKTLLIGSAWGAMAFGALVLFAPRAEAYRPILLCGPTYLWVCSGPGGPDILFPGTICEKFVFERKTGLTCVPYGG